MRTVSQPGDDRRATSHKAACYVGDGGLRKPAAIHLHGKLSLIITAAVGRGVALLERDFPDQLVPSL